MTRCSACDVYGSKRFKFPNNTVCSLRPPKEPIAFFSVFFSQPYFYIMRLHLALRFLYKRVPRLTWFTDRGNQDI